jgi:iron only hydrogenase large subunit-like protein
VQASKNAWGFAASGGVLEAVKSKLPEDIDIKPTVFNGIDRKALKQLKVLKKTGKFNFVEGMSCEGGCLGGCYMDVKPMVTQKRWRQ